MVLVPWPISVEAVRIRNVPSARASNPIVPWSFFSPLPVKPEPWNPSDNPRRRRTGGMNGRARQDDGSQRAVCPAIQHDLDVLKDQCSILFDAGAVPDDSWMTLGRRREFFVPVVDQANGASSFAREERGMNRHDRRVLLLAAEPSSCFRLDYDRLLIGELH